MIKKSFVHLHNHTEYSMLDGAARVKDLLNATADMGMPALAMTDHGNVFGAYEFWKAANATPVKPVIGMEGYLTPMTHRTDRSRVLFGSGGRDDVSADGAYTHLTLWAETTHGLHNLFRLSSLASMEGFFQKPRIDRELLQTHGQGIIATTGCASGEIQTRLRLGQYHAARDAAAEMRDILGDGNYFLELMDHGLGIEQQVRDDLLRLARDLALPLVATNDLHYVRAEDHTAHAALLCVQSGSTLDDPTRFKFDSDEFYLKSPEQMRHLWRDLPEACDNTLEIADRCSVAFDEGSGTLMPRFPVPAGETEESWFVAEVERGLRRRYGDDVPADVRQRAEYETQVIARKRYCGYFLVVADFIGWAKGNGIRVGPGRGSGAGSMCAYALGITGLDPLLHNLMFERFLNPERPSMPDFDIDFDERRREEVIRYVTGRYGSDRVAQIVTYGTIKAKQAVKDSVRVLGLPYSLGDQITKIMPQSVMGKDVPLAGVFDPAHPRHADGAQVRERCEADHDTRRALDTARGLEGLKRQWGVHAAGVIMSSEPLLDVVPIMRRGADGAIITQFDYPACEALGLVKMDFLGLRNLTIIEDTLANIAANGHQVPVLEDLPLDDASTFALLAKGATLGVFQLDGGPMRSLLVRVQPVEFSDISAVLALYRPGPMGVNAHLEYADRKNGRKRAQPIHPELAEPLADILDETYSVVVYQEQVVSIAQRVAGYSVGRADLLRKAMGKKKKEVLDAEYVPFSEGMRAAGYSDAAIKALWDVLVPFADYAFNRAHTACYGMIAYWTAYLKVHHTAEYMAALLTSVGDEKDKMAVYLNECRHLGVPTLQPDVNSSVATFTAVDEGIRFGLAAIRNVGAAVVEGIVAARAAQGPFESLEDFLRKCPASVANRKTVESLIKAGAFDSFGQPRQGLLAASEGLIDAVGGQKKAEAVGQFSLFGEDEFGPHTIPQIEWSRHVRMGLEREMLGLYLSDHPLRGSEERLAAWAENSIADVLEDGLLADEASVVLAGLVVDLTVKVSRKGDRWAIVTLEDLTGSMECLVFPKAYAAMASVIATDQVLAVSGKISRRDDTPSIFVNSVDVIARDWD